MRERRARGRPRRRAEVAVHEASQQAGDRRGFGVVVRRDPGRPHGERRRVAVGEVGRDHRLTGPGGGVHQRDARPVVPLDDDDRIAAKSGRDAVQEPVELAFAARHLLQVRRVTRRAPLRRVRRPRAGLGIPPFQPFADRSRRAVAVIDVREVREQDVNEHQGACACLRQVFRCRLEHLEARRRRRQPPVPRPGRQRQHSREAPASLPVPGLEARVRLRLAEERPRHDRELRRQRHVERVEQVEGAAGVRATRCRQVLGAQVQVVGFVNLDRVPEPREPLEVLVARQPERAIRRTGGHQALLLRVGQVQELRHRVVGVDVLAVGVPEEPEAAFDKEALHPLPESGRRQVRRQAFDADHLVHEHVDD